MLFLFSHCLNKKILYKREFFYLLVKKTEACYDKTHIMVDNTEADGSGESHGRTRVGVGYLQGNGMCKSEIVLMGGLVCQ